MGTVVTLLRDIYCTCHLNVHRFPVYSGKRRVLDINKTVRVYIKKIISKCKKKKERKASVAEILDCVLYPVHLDSVHLFPPHENVCFMLF